MQRNAISIKVLTFHRQKRIDLNPIHPRKHQKVTRASSLITLSHHYLSTQLKFPYPSRLGINDHAILGIQSYPHKIYLIVSMSICDIYNLASTMEEEIAEIQELYNRIPQQLIALFTTSLEEYPLPTQELQLQSSFDQEALNQLVASLLEQDNLPRFDFLIEGQLLRGELKSHIIRHNLTAEQTLNIEYILSFPNIDQHSKSPEQDWISSIALIPGPDNIVGLAAALYNGDISVYDISLKQLGKFKVDSDPLKSVAVMPGSIENTYFCVSGGMGEVLAVHTIQFNSNIKATQISSNNHSGCINCISVSPGADTHFATGGAEGLLSIWEIPEGFQSLGAHNAVKSKKKKKEVNLNVLPLLASSQVFDGTIECLSWLNNEEVIAGSSRHKMTITNISKMQQTQTFLTRDSVVTSIDSTDSLILSAHEDGQIRLWDKRTPAKPTHTFKAHSKWASAARFNRQLPFNFSSGSHDRTLKIWDMRCSFPLQNIQAEQEKVLALEWLSDRSLACGGSDSSIHIHSAH